MIKYGLIGATALSFALAVPAMARDVHHARVARVHPYPNPPVYDYDGRLPVQDATRWGYSQGYSNYPSGWGGLYGDGRYPGNVISNPNHPF